LSHFNIGHDQPNPSVVIDADEGVRREGRMSIRRCGRPINWLLPRACNRERPTAPQQCESEHQPAVLQDRAP
jgi:hypothetical protein